MIPETDSIGLSLNNERMTEGKFATLKPPSDQLSSQSEKIWTKVKSVKSEVFNISHKGVEQMMSDYRFSTIEERQGAWGVQPINVKVRLFQCACKTENLDLWKVLVENGADTGSTEAWCFIDSKWNNFFLLEKDFRLALFGAGLIGFHGYTVTLMMLEISEMSSMINLSEFLPEITIDFFSGIGGW